MFGLLNDGTLIASCLTNASHVLRLMNLAVDECLEEETVFVFR